MTPPHTAEQCRQKVRDLIAEAVPETDDARREGLLEMADQWIEVARRRTDVALSVPPARLASLRDW